MHIVHILYLTEIISIYTLHLHDMWNDIKYKTNIVWTIISNFKATLWSNIKHTLILIYYRLTVSLPNKSPNKLIGKNVIIFVHGWYGSPTSVTPLIEYLSKTLKRMPNDELFNNDFAPNDNVFKFPNNKYYVIRAISIGKTSHTDKACDTLNNEMQNFENCNITFIGLSQGGLVIMRYITQYEAKYNKGLNNVIETGISVSAPLHGTLTANLCPASFAAHQELGYDNIVSKQIAENIKNLSNVKICHVVPKYDILIQPTSSAMYETSDENNILHYDGTDYGHFGIIFHDKVAKHIVKCISEY